MNSAKVIGKTYSEFMHSSLKGKSIKIIQAFNIETGELTGKPFFSVDAVGADIGELVAFEAGFQSIWAFEDHMIPVDCTITAIIDSFDIDKEGQKK